MGVQMKLPYSAKRAGLGPFLAALTASISLLPVAAQAEVRSAGGEPLEAQLAALPTGDQLLLEGHDGTLDFAGRSLTLNQFTGIASYTSQIAYVLVIEGEAEIDGVRAGRGRMLLVPAFGGEVVAERFDAARLHSALEQHDIVPMLASLADLAREQARGVFVGRLGRTGFNVSTFGSAEQELIRRARTGGQTVRETRFAGAASGEDFERRVVTRFLAALAGGEAQAVAELLDPAPYGLVHGTPEASNARLAMARALLARRDWRAFADAQPTSAGNASWLADVGEQRATIELIPTRDFTFVRSIETEG